MRRRSAAVRGVPASSPSSRRARFRGAVSLIKLKQYDEAFNALTALAADGDEAAVFNNLGVVQLRRGSSTQTGKPAYFLTKAAKAEPNDPDVPLQSRIRLRDRSRSAGVDLLAAGGAPPKSRGQRSAPGAGVRARVGGQHRGSRSGARARRTALLEIRGERTHARRSIRCRAASSESGRISSPATTRASIWRSSARRSATSRMPPQFHLDRGRRLFEREQDRDAMAELRRAVFLSPYEADAHLLIGRIHLRGGPSAGGGRCAEDLDLEPRRRAGPRRARGGLSAAQGSRQRPTAGRSVRSTLDPSSADARRLLERIDRPGSRSPNQPSPRAQRERPPYVDPKSDSERGNS